MGNSLYFVAAVLVVGWLIAFFGFYIGGYIHLLLIFAGIAILVNVIRGKNAF